MAANQLSHYARNQVAKRDLTSIQPTHAAALPLALFAACVVAWPCCTANAPHNCEAVWRNLCLKSFSSRHI